MKALIVENNLVVHVASDFSIIDNAYYIGHMCTGISTERGAVVDISETCPGLFVPMAWKIENNTWVVASPDAIEGEEIYLREQKASEVRAQRDKLLAASDWTQLPDVALSDKTEWATYRQELRDVSQQEGFPFNVIWPQPPKAQEPTPVEII